MHAFVFCSMVVACLFPFGSSGFAAILLFSDPGMDDLCQHQDPADLFQSQL
jgi:hypothetical protein